MALIEDSNNEVLTQEIEQWIAECFKYDENNVPKFIATAESKQLMTKIIQVNKIAEKDAKEAIKLDNHLIQMYCEKKNEIKSLLPEVLIKVLNPDVLKRVEKIAAVACNMNLELPTLTNLLAGFVALNKIKMQQEENELINAFKLSELSKKISDTIKKNEILKRQISSLERVTTDQQSVLSHIESQCKFISNKITEYNRRIKKSKQHLQSVGFHPSLSHSSLVQRVKPIKDLEEKVKSLTLKLKSYQDLPPNEMMTEFKVGEAQKELSELQKEFETLLFASS